MGQSSLNPSEPPDHGELSLSLDMPPASRQATTAAKKRVKSAIRELTRPLKYLLDGYVWITLDWQIHERFRWESDASADIDNIIKPLLDALSGPDGVIIDDSQVKSLSSNWFAITTDDQRVDIKIEFIKDEWLPKDGLVFVRIKGPLCYPVPASVRERGLNTWLQWLTGVNEAREKIEKITSNYYPARYLMSHRYFHRSRLGSFEVLELSQLEAEARSQSGMVSS